MLLSFAQGPGRQIAQAGLSAPPLYGLCPSPALLAHLTGLLPPAAPTSGGVRAAFTLVGSVQAGGVSPRATLAAGASPAALTLLSTEWGVPFTQDVSALLADGETVNSVLPLVTRQDVTHAVVTAQMVAGCALVGSTIWLTLGVPGGTVPTALYAVTLALVTSHGNVRNVTWPWLYCPQ